MMWLEKIFVSTSAILRDYMIGLAFDAGKGSIEKRCSDRQLRKN